MLFLNKSGPVLSVKIMICESPFDLMNFLNRKEIPAFIKKRRGYFTSRIRFMLAFVRLVYPLRKRATTMIPPLC